MKKIVLLLCTVLISGTLFSQITNVRKWRKTEKDSLDMALLMYEEGLYLQALPIFDAINSHHPNEEFIRYSYAKCALFRSDKHEDAYDILSSIYARNKRIDEIDYDVARAAHYVTKLDEAMTAVNAYLAKPRLSADNRAKAELLKRYITNAQLLVAKPTPAKSTNLGPAINSEWEEYVPAVTSDESTMIFTYQGDKSLGGLLNDQSQSDPSGSYHEDLYISKKVNGSFAKAEPLSTINTDGNEAAIAVSNDGSRLFVYRDNSDDHGDIYESRLVGNDYTAPVKLRGLVNSYSWDGHCSLSPDGRTLYFSSERGGGYGGRDIYRATIQPDSTWGNIVNLGDSVNSTFDEDAPFIHPDGVTLYFSSKGRNSMGGYDVFRSVMNPADSLFKRSDNLGYPINSTDDDIYFVVAANGKTAYYSSGKKGGLGLKDIYVVEPNFETSPALYLVKGAVKADGVPAEADINVVQTSRNNATYGNFKANRVTGNYLLALPAGAAYKITFSYQAMPAQVLELDGTALTAYTEKIHDVNFVAAVAVADTSAKPTETVAAMVKDSLVAGTPSATVATNNTSKDKDGFVPQNSHQQKTMWYVDKYGDIRADELVFKVQIGAFKNADNIVYPNLDGLGRIQKTPTDDGLIRVTIGGDFKTLRRAFDFNKKVIAAGQSDAFVTMIYKGKRVTLEDLERDGVFNKNKKGSSAPAAKDTVGWVQPLNLPDAGSWMDGPVKTQLTLLLDRPVGQQPLFYTATCSIAFFNSKNRGQLAASRS